LAVEVITSTTTADEILDKIRDYFFTGVQLVWVIYPRQRYVYVYTADDKVVILTEKGELDGGDVLPGFRLPLAGLFNVSAPPA
jgi:Uma2 family endonuclease